MLAVGMDDRLNQPVTDHVALVEKVETNVFDLPQRFHRFNQAAPLVSRKIDLSAIAGDNALQSCPRRVRNINICSVVVF